MGKIPYHSYLFFQTLPAFYQQEDGEKNTQKLELQTNLQALSDVKVEAYSTLGLKANTAFMLWIRAQKPEDIQAAVQTVITSSIGPWVYLTGTYFGISRESTYSGRTGKPDQDMQQFDDRLPYLILYPFTKTTKWYQMDFEARKKIMGEHIKTGVSFPSIRQCLLYSFGLDDYEFLVSYETTELEPFQDLVMQMRSTASRLYTKSDTPIFTCIHRPLENITEWL